MKLAQLLRKALERFAQRFEVRIVGDNNDVMLSRYVIHDGGRDGWRVFLHQFHRPDGDMELHNHPWGIALCLVLFGGYYEERRTGDGVITRIVRPGTINWITANTFHRVAALRSGESWSLVVASPITQSWGFWDRETNIYIPWRDFISQKRGL